MGRWGAFVGCILVCLCLFLYGSAAAGQPLLDPATQPRFEWLGRADGLSNLSVSAIVQDRYGFMWFATQNGLNLYDGQQITVLQSDPFSEDSLIHNLIQTMYYDEDLHHLWLGTYQGLSLYRIESGEFLNYPAGPNGLSNPVVTAITKDPRTDGVWVGTLNGLNYLGSAHGQWTQFQPPGDVVRALAFDHKDRLWVGTYEGLYHFDYLNDQWLPVDAELPSPSVMAISHYEPGRFLLGLWGGGVAELEIETGEVTVHSLADNRVYTVWAADDGSYWAGTWGGGLYAIMPSGQIRHFGAANNGESLRHPVVYSLLQDHSGILWIGTNGGGLHKLNPRKRNYLRFSHKPGDPTSLALGKINAMHRDQRGSLWIAVYNMGLNRYDETTDIMLHYGAAEGFGLPADNINAILETAAGDLLFGTNDGLVRYIPGEDRFEPFAPHLPGQLIYALAEHPDGSLWLGTYADGVVRYEPATGAMTTFRHQPGVGSSLADDLVYDILIDSQDRIWIATNNGLNRFLGEEEGFQRYRRVPGNAQQLGTNSIRTLFEDSFGQLWIGTAGAGLYLYQEDGTFLHFLENNGMPSNVVVSMEEDEQQRLWLGTHGGLAVMDIAERTLLAVLTEDDGLGGWEFNGGSFHDSDGTLYFGGVHGITAMRDFLGGERLTPPRVYVTNVERIGQDDQQHRPFFNGQQITLGPGNNYVAFEFTATDYNAPDKTNFSYMLEGFDSAWIHAGSRTYATYSNLPPGQYRLLVSAVTAAGTEAVEPAVVYLNVEPPWYRNWWAYLLYLGLFAAIIAVGIRLLQWELLQRRNAELAYANERLETLNGELARLSVKDSLTGLFNRRYFDSRLEEQLAAARRTRVPLSLIMLDLDHFKEYNDSLGHVAGDALLSAVSQAAQETLHRRTDFLARYGGDEMAAVLFDTDAAGAQRQAERLHQTMVRVMREQSEATGHPIPPTVSLGVVTVIPGRDTQFTDVIEAADTALYQAKKAGKNRIVTESLDPAYP